MKTKLDNFLNLVNLRIILVVLLRDAYDRCVYRVYTSDGGFSEFIGFDALPGSVRDWMAARNSFAYVVPSAMVISGVEVVS